MTDPINVLCPACQSSAGDPCRDCYARAKPTCSARVNAVVRTGAGASPAPEAAPDPLAIACPKCGAAPASKCKDYRGQGKATCKERVPLPCAHLPEGEQSADPTVPTANAPSVDRLSAPAKVAPVTEVTDPASGRDDFDESTPPPRPAARGTPINADVTLPPGEDTAGIFAQWDREGRVPAGSILCESRCLSALCDGGEPFVVVARGSGAPPEPAIDRYRVTTWIRREPSSFRHWCVLSPLKAPVK